jgi:hypothetical protein
MAPFEFGHLGILTTQYRNMVGCTPEKNYSFDSEDFRETLGYYNWNYTTDCIEANRVFLNRNFIIIQ